MQLDNQRLTLELHPEATIDVAVEQDGHGGLIDIHLIVTNPVYDIGLTDDQEFGDFLVTMLTIADAGRLRDALTVAIDRATTATTGG